MFISCPINDMPDIMVVGSLKGLTAYHDIPDAWINTPGLSKVLLKIHRNEPDIDTEEVSITDDIPLKDIRIMGVMSTNGDYTEIERDILDLKYDDLTLYHGTSENSADAILGGWEPNSGHRGANFGQRQFLYCTTLPENALWFAQENGGKDVLAIKVRMKSLIVDPEDGISSSVVEELLKSLSSGFPGNFAITEKIPASKISRLQEDLRPSHIREHGSGQKSSMRLWSP
mgnify:CR=1 FL=1